VTADKTAPPAGDQTRAHAPLEGATNRCPACGHVSIPARRCGNPECRHLAEFHDMPRGKTTRKACSISNGPKAVRCPCTAFTPEDPETSP
jgi:ribosomal protein L32